MHVDKFLDARGSRKFGMGAENTARHASGNGQSKEGSNEDRFGARGRSEEASVLRWSQFSKESSVATRIFEGRVIRRRRTGADVGDNLFTAFARRVAERRSAMGCQ